MKNLLSLCFVVLFSLTGCKKDNSTPTPSTTSYVGEYKLTGTETFTTNGVQKVSQINDNVTLFVFQGNTPNSYYFLERWPATETGYFVTVSNQTFQMEVATDETFFDGNRWVGYRNGDGKFDGKSIVLQRNTPSFSILNFTGPQYAPTTIKSMSRVVNLVATPK